jgi:tRNA pseudouridine38-40 synthase
LDQDLNMTRYKVVLQYDGGNYHGFQIQPNAITVQEVIEDSLTKLSANKKVKIVGCGRTDTGVHASYFVIHFDLSMDLNNDDLHHKMSCMLPKDIAIIEVKHVHKDFHARFDAVSRSYEYKISYNNSVFGRDYILHSKTRFNIDLMNEALKDILGRHDFRAFAKNIEDSDTAMCNLTKADWINTKEGITLQITANRFLRNMVRRIVGACLDVGSEKEDTFYLKRLLDSKKPNNNSKTAEGQALFLSYVEY